MKERIVGPCSKYIDGLGWTTDIPDYLLEAKGWVKKEKDTTVVDTVDAMLQKFGEDSQIDVAIEEMSELIKELVKYKRSKLHFREKQAASREHVVEEMGDVMFMIEYLKKIFQISDKEIEEIVVEKAKRTQRRYLYAQE